MLTLPPAGLIGRVIRGFDDLVIGIRDQQQARRARLSAAA
jgi:hypothetical protein